MRFLVLLTLILLAGCAAQPSGPITPVVDDAAVVDGQLTASGSVMGIAEDGGTCQYTFYAESGEASRLTSTGVAAGDHTDCGEVSESATMVLAGTYSLVLTYRSGGVVERSEAVTVEIPAS